MQVFLAKGTRIEQCFSALVSKQKLPIPPIIPAYMPMSINIKCPEPEESEGPIVESTFNSEN